MGKRKKEEKAPVQASKINTIKQSMNSITEDLSPIKKTKRHKHTDGEIQSTCDETKTDNKNVTLTEDLKKKKKKKKHKHVEIDYLEKTDHTIETKNFDSTSSSVRVHQSLEDSLLEVEDDKKKVKKRKAKKKRLENKEDITLACEDVVNKPETEISVENSNATKGEEEEAEKRRQEKKQKKKDKKLKKELEKQKGSETGKDEEKPVGPSIAQLALEYLKQWNTERTQWKFQKVRQVWLLQNIYHGDKIGAEHFKVLLLYLEGMKGKSREITVKQAEEILAVNENPSENTTEVTEVKLDRARQIIQVLAQ